MRVNGTSNGTSSPQHVEPKYVHDYDYHPEIRQLIEGIHQTIPNPYTLNKLGNQIKTQVHIFNFIEAIVLQSDLKEIVKSWYQAPSRFISGDHNKWNQFLKGVIGRLKTADELQILCDHVPRTFDRLNIGDDLAKKNYFFDCYDESKWEELVVFVVNDFQIP